MAKKEKPLAALILGEKMPKDDEEENEVKVDMGQRILDAIAAEDPEALVDAIRDCLDY